MSFMNTVGYRFYPTEEELLGFYLRHKLENTRTLDIERFIPVLDVYKYHPSDLQYMAGESNRRDPEQWFFFCSIQERELQGGRPARTTLSGYWKATGSPNYVFSSSNKTIGMKRTMVFYQGRAPTGTKTKWKMNEYKAFRHAFDGVPAEPPEMRLEFSLCRVCLRTATLRSFDRRPVNTAIIENHISLEASTSNGNGKPVVPHLYERNDSTGSSSSGDLCLRNNSEEEEFDWNLFNDIDMDFNLF